MQAIRLLERTSREYANLQLACDMFRMQNPELGFAISDGYYDFGQDWKWTSIEAVRTDPDDREKFSTFWVLCPRAHEQIVNAANVVDIALAVRDSNPARMDRRNYNEPARPMKIVQKLVHRIYVMEGREQEAIDTFKSVGGEIWLEDETAYSLEEDA